MIKCIVSIENRSHFEPSDRFAEIHLMCTGVNEIASKTEMLFFILKITFNNEEKR